jgi:cell division septation protein DedD
MENKSPSKVYIFDKKELFLLFFFFIFMAVTSFILGMKFGKNQADFFLGDHSAKPVDKNKMKEEFKSNHEELVDKKIDEADVFKDHGNSSEGAEGVHEEPGTAGNELGKEASASNGEHSSVEGTGGSHTASASAKNKDMDEETFKKLQSEFEKINIKDMAENGKNENGETRKEGATSSEQASDLSSSRPPEISETAAKDDNFFLKPDQSYLGKFTIQLGSYKTLDEAKSFAEGFLGRGYKPLIKETELPRKGVWYRVSLGVFESISAAKQYISNEKSLFQSQQYVISEIR